jgi:hypothetical protein
VAIASSTSICAGNSATLSASGASSYTWNPGGTGTSIVVTPAGGTSYVLSGSVSGCPTRSVSVYVSVNPLPALSVSSSSALICAGEMVALAVNGASSYTWDNGSSSTVLIVTPTVTTIYTVTGTSAVGCVATSAFTQSVSDCAGISVVPGQSPNQIFPNPSNGVFSIHCGMMATVMIKNVTGSVVAVAEPGEDVRNFELYDLPAGVYIVKTSVAGTNRYDKILITR